MPGPQNHMTPDDFLDACEHRFGPIVFDLAADDKSHVVGEYFDETEDSLLQDWFATYIRVSPDGKGWMWLNPPFSGGPKDPESGKSRSIKDWIKKCWEESRKGCRILLLVPYSADSNWFDDWVRGKARDEAIKGRIKFVGSDDPFMKPLCLIIFEPEVSGAGGGAWAWKRTFERVNGKKTRR